MDSLDGVPICAYLQAIAKINQAQMAILFLRNASDGIQNGIDKRRSVDLADIVDDEKGIDNLRPGVPHGHAQHPQDHDRNLYSCQVFT